VKVLCVCEGGNVRSRALAYMLHDLYHHEAIPVGWRWSSAETLAMLCGWADLIVVMQPWMTGKIAADHAAKVRVVDVGPDTYGLSIPTRLMDAITSAVGFRDLIAELRVKR